MRIIKKIKQSIFSNEFESHSQFPDYSLMECLCYGLAESWYRFQALLTKLIKYCYYVVWSMLIQNICIGLFISIKKIDQIYTFMIISLNKLNKLPFNSYLKVPTKYTPIRYFNNKKHFAYPAGGF